MSNTLVQRIHAMDEFRLLRFFDAFGRGIFTTLDLDRDKLLDLVEPAAHDDPEVGRVLDLRLSAEKARTPLDRADAVRVARSTLEAMAHNPGLAPGLERALDEMKDEEMPATAILALGFAVSMIIVAATTKLNLRYAGGKFEGALVKEAASPDVLKEIVGPLADASSKLSPSG
jgi:hypothetical protein